MQGTKCGFFAMAAVVLLAGCQTQEPARPEITPENMCSEALRLLDDPYASDWQKAALFEAMRNRGCFG
jgi:hypothetical protein